MFAKILAVAACAFSIVAQAQTKLQFTQTPANAQVGVPTTIKWTGSDPNSAVTITLRKGPDPNNLSTITIITGDATGTSFDWTPSTSIPPADDYALQISQGEDSTNYSGFFSILGGSASSTTVVAVAGSTTIPITTIAPNVTSTANVSVTAILTSAASSSGTGTALPRNTTFVSQTLSAAATSGVGVSAGTLPATTSQAGATGSASSPASTASAAGGAALRAKLEVGFGAVVGAAALFVL